MKIEFKLFVLGMVLTTIWALIMPSVQFSLYFYKNRGPVINSIIIDQKMIHSKIIESTKENPDKTIIKVCKINHLSTLWKNNIYPK